MPPFRAELRLDGLIEPPAYDPAPWHGNHDIPERALRANPESRRTMMLLDSGFARQGAGAPE
jgi:hypothetical protein